MRFQLFQRGQAALGLSMALPVMVGAACIGADSWALHHSAVRLQALADEAVLTGAAYLPSNPVLAERATVTKALMAGIGESEIVYSRPAADGRSITMVVERSVPYRFTRLFGLSQSQVIVKAVAASGRPQWAAGLVPIGIQYASDSTSYRAHRAIILQPATAERPAAESMWRPLEIGSCDAGRLPSRGTFVGSQSPVGVGDVLRVQTGDRGMAIRSALLARLYMGARSDPGASATNYATGDPRRIEVALVDFNHDSQDAIGSTASVRGFASLWLTSVDAQGNIGAELLDLSPGTGPQSRGARSEIGAFAIVEIMSRGKNLYLDTNKNGLTC